MTWRRNAQKGFSLVEVLIAVAILAIVMTMSLMIYDSTRRSFKLGENLSEQQQLVRVAFDKITRDLRMAGLNHNPDGNRSRPDEQIEAAYATAIAFRADFDGEDPAKADTPEATLIGNAFLSVSTGNDEIVIYALAKADGTDSDEVFFRADVVDVPRDGEDDDIRIPGISLAQSDPPYTLYRIIVAADGSSGHRAPMAENIHHMRFTYFDSVGNEIDPSDGGDTETDRIDRAAIRRIEVEIEGMTRDPEIRWVDPEDTDPGTRHHRKFRLAGSVTPRNLGLTGLRDIGADTNPPSTPALGPDLYPNHCGGLLVHWQPNPLADEVVYYRVRFGESPPGTLTDQRSSATTFYYLGGLNDATDYVVGIQAVDGAGNASALSPTSTLQTFENTVPEAVSSIGLTPGSGSITLTWPFVGRNTISTPGDPRGDLIRDLAGYRVYRDSSSGFTPSPTNRVADENVVGPWQTTRFDDRQVAQCELYYYQVTAVDLCGVEGAPSPEESASSVSDGFAPATPINVQAYKSGPSTVHLQWDPVLQNTEGDSIFVRKYGVFASGNWPSPPAAPPGPSDFFQLAEVNDTYHDDSVSLLADETVYYFVTARNSCESNNESAASDFTFPECTFEGQLEIREPENWDIVSGSVDVEVALQGANPTLTYVLTLTFIPLDGGTTVDVVVAGAPPWTRTWDTSSLTPGPYRIQADVEQTDGADTCSMSNAVVVGVVAP